MKHYNRRLSIKKYTIYKYTSPEGKHYIGKTSNEAGRKLAHKYGYSSYPDRELYQDMNKFGYEAFTYTTLVTGVPDWASDSFEKYWINYYDSYNQGYNQTLGGIGSKGYKHSDASKDKIAKAFKAYRESPNCAFNTQEYKDNMSVLMKQRVLSDEHKYKLKLANRNRYISIKCIETGEVFVSMKEASLKYKVSSSSLGSACRGKLKKVGGFHWEFIN